MRLPARLAAHRKLLGVVEQTLYNWIKLDRDGQLNGAGAQPISPEQMEIARLRAELSRVKMERDILMALGHPEKATAFFAKEST